MKAETMISLLGKTSTDKGVESLLKDFGVKKPPKLPRGEYEYCAWVPVKRHGIEFGFEDEGHFKALGGPVSKGPLLFTQIIFYNRPGEIGPYGGELPYGLLFTDRRKEVREKLGQFDAFRRSYLKDVWELPDHRLIVSYSDGDGVADVIIQLRRFPSPQRPGKSPAMPRVNKIVALFGTEPADKKFLSTFGPLDILDQMDDIIEYDEADLRKEYGLEIGFDTTKCGNPEAPYVFGMISAVFYGDRVYEARRWEGELPCGLSFNDDQPAMFAKVGKKPDERNDDLTDGYALWNLKEYSLKVLYSNMENRLLRVSMIAPWYLEEADEDDDDDE